MTRAILLGGAVLAAAFCLLLGMALRRDEHVPARWLEDDDGIAPVDPYTWTLA